MNDFSPSDNKFSVHYDTPFVDHRNKHYSLYTLIIYLTEGENKEKPALKFYCSDNCLNNLTNCE